MGEIYNSVLSNTCIHEDQIDDDEIFFDILKTFATRYKHKIVESKDFIELVNEKTYSDYSWFFKQYLNNRKELITCLFFFFNEQTIFFFMK